MDIEKKFRFKKFPVYILAREFNQHVKALTGSFPSQEQYQLTAQLYRSLDSIVLNIAEGSSRNTDKDFAHFLNMATASLNEVVASLDLALDSRYFTAEAHKQSLLRAAELANQLTAFRKTLIVKA